MQGNEAIIGVAIMISATYISATNLPSTFTPFPLSFIIRPPFLVILLGLIAPEREAATKNGLNQAIRILQVVVIPNNHFH